MTNETKEISIIKRNLRLIKRIILGKKNPSIFFMIISIMSMLFSLVTILIILGVLFLIYISPEVEVLKDLSLLDHRFYVSFIVLNIISIFGVVLMWRKNIIGMYVYILIGVLISFWNVFFMPISEISYYLLGVYVVFIVLFLLGFRFSKNNVDSINN